MLGLNHVTERCWEYGTRILAWRTSSAANPGCRELTANESKRSAVPSRRAGRNTSCAEFETIISSRVDNLLFLRLVPAHGRQLYSGPFFLCFFFLLSRRCASPVIHRGRSERAWFLAVLRGSTLDRVKRRSRKHSDL